MPADIQGDIKDQISIALEQLGADPRLRAIVGSWGDTLTDAAVLEALKDWNAGEFKMEIMASTGEIETQAAIQQAKQRGELHILFDGKPGDLRFVECEDAAGRSRRVGLMRKRGDGLHELVITSLPTPR